MAPTKKNKMPTKLTNILKVGDKFLKKNLLFKISPYIKSFYANGLPENLSKKSTSELFQRAYHNWLHGKIRKNDTHLIRVFNPKIESDGYQSENTVIEIITDDMPFIVSSITSSLNVQKLNVELLIHQIIKVNRKINGEFNSIIENKKSKEAFKNESLVHIEITRQPKIQLSIIKSQLEFIVSNLKICKKDEYLTRSRIISFIDDIHPLPKGLDINEMSEIQEFITWLCDHHFTFLGARDYKIEEYKNKQSASIEKGSGLGLLRNPKYSVFTNISKNHSTSTELTIFQRSQDIILVTKTNRRSTVDRPLHMDAIGIKKFDNDGTVAGYRLFVGLFTQNAYNHPPSLIPLLRKKLENVFKRSNFSPSSHNGFKLKNILETYPRDELFQIAENTLLNTALGILTLEERPRTAVFVREDKLKRFCSCLVYISREKYNTDLRQKIETILAEELNGSISAFYVQLDDNPLARCQIIIKMLNGIIPNYSNKKIEKRLTEVTQSWTDNLEKALKTAYGGDKAFEIQKRWVNRFEPGYKDLYNSNEVVKDISYLEKALETEQISLNLYRSKDAHFSTARFKIYTTKGVIPLSDVIPIFEDMGFRVIDEMGPHFIDLGEINKESGTIHNFGLKHKNGLSIDLKNIRKNFHQTFYQVWYQSVESDGFNALTTGANLSWRNIIIIRAYSKYLRQIGIKFSQKYMELTLSSNPKITRNLISLFLTRFNPNKNPSREKQYSGHQNKICAAIESVANADQDQILRKFWNLIESTTRTNYFQKTASGQNKSYLSFKFNCASIENLPLPKPFREIFVYSRRIEGLHLRFGYIARGGLRWSDRPEDFRTEVLGLVKAQQVKNAVIVPVGSKGGFVVKNSPNNGNREALQNEGISCYKILISGILDLTDNIKGTKITPPKDLIRMDDNDPYLVVAADKGTATFSDIANKLSLNCDYWLGDAFASGGSQGYDHKKMGITARGGWESVKRHFREIGKNIQIEDFTVIGIGDMSGDVFGNGMLLSKHIKLLAAFNHLQIFVDPDPDPKKSWEERFRLFNSKGTTWADYNPKQLSKGGAIFDRSAKKLPLSEEIKKCFNITKTIVTPTELLQKILGAKVELLWFGGIGTYVKSSSESNFDAGDKANDLIRINGKNLACKVVGEGANLGCTQLGRIEYSMNGGRLNTDAIDNSAGVDSSDHEVNIKIVIASAINSQKLNKNARNKLLASMTNEVGNLVLVHNYRQSQAISQIEAFSKKLLGGQHRFLKMLERENRLNRNIEFLPSDDIFLERGIEKKGLYRPEISVLLSYSKNWLYDQIVTSNLPDDPYLIQDLINYFPKPLQIKYKKEIKSHRLKREIISTRISNALVDRVGDIFVHTFMEKTSFSPPQISHAFIVAVEVYQIQSLWAELEDLDNKVDSVIQVSMRADINALIHWAVLWLLRNGKSNLDLGASISELKGGMTHLTTHIEQTMPTHYQKDTQNRAKSYIDGGVPRSLALKISGLVNLYFACDIVELSIHQKINALYTAKVYFEIESYFKLGHLRAAASALETENHWTKLAVSSSIEELYSHQLNLTNLVLNKTNTKLTAQKNIEEWIRKNNKLVEPTKNLLKELWATEINDLSMIAVASRQIKLTTQK